MKNKTLKEFFERYSANPTLDKKVWKQGCVDWKIIKEYPQDYQNASIGSVIGMIYYDDTVKFAKNNLEEIHEYLVEVEKELGPLNVPNFRDSEICYYNWLTWFMWEDLARRLWDYLEEDYDEEDYY